MRRMNPVADVASAVTAQALPLRDGPFRFAPATAADRDEINRLLAENPMAGQISVSLEHAPDPLVADFGLSDNHVAILARQGDAPNAIGYCERTTWRAYVNGVPGDLPYLGALRVAHAHRGRIRVLRGGFAALRQLAERSEEIGFALTAIARDNLVARRVLGAGISGLPRYTELSDFETLFMRARLARPDPEIRTAKPTDMPRILALLTHANARRNLAPVWSAEALAKLEGAGLAAEDFLLAETGGELIGCLAVWDQSAHKQAVIRGYSRTLGMLRPSWNLIAPLTGRPGLPPVGARIEQACLSHLALAEPDPTLLFRLVSAARDLAWRKGIATVHLGLPAADPVLSLLRRKLHAVSYVTTLYAVHWSEQPAPELDPNLPIHPEAGLM